MALTKNLPAGTLALPIGKMLREIEQSRRRLAGGVLVPPCIESASLAELTGMRIFCKLDNLQHTASFKERGARNALLQLSTAQPKRGAATLADGLSVPQIGAQAFAIVRKRVDEIVRVSEDEIALAILRILELEKTVVEGAGATPLAACLSGNLKHLCGKRVVLALCGGNIDPNILDSVIEKGLVVDGRLTRFTAVISDRPGSLAKLARLRAEAGPSIKEAVPDREFAGADVSTVKVLCTIEIRDHGHVRQVHRLLQQNGIHFSRTFR